MDFVLFADRRTSPCKVSVLKLRALNLPFTRANENRGSDFFLFGLRQPETRSVVLRKISASPEVIGFCRKFLPPGFFAPLSEQVSV